MSESEPLRTQLAVLRDDALSQLAAGAAIDSGLLQLFADAGAALAAIDTAAVAVDAAPKARVRWLPTMANGLRGRCTVSGARRLQSSWSRAALHLTAELLAAGLRQQ